MDVNRIIFETAYSKGFEEGYQRGVRDVLLLPKMINSFNEVCSNTVALLEILAAEMSKRKGAGENDRR